MYCMGCMQLMSAAVVVLGVMAAIPSLAGAQTLYVAGDAFLDLRRSSGTETTGSTKDDWTTGGGGVRVGGFLAPSWSVELGVDLGATATRTRQTTPLPLATGGLFVSPVAIPSFMLSTSNRATATSVLLGYHPVLRSHARLRPGFRAGMTFLHSSTSTDENILFPLGNTLSTVIGTMALLPSIPPTVTRITTVTNEIAATVGGEVAVGVTRHGAVVPEVRALGVNSRYIIRPGVAFRWTF